MKPNPENIKGVLFDLDGTLVSNYRGIHSCIEETLSSMGLPVPSYEKVVKTVGGSILLTFEKIIGCARAAEAAELYVKLFPKHIFDGLESMPFALEILKALKARGMKLACLTNKGQEAAEDILEKLGMLKFLDGVMGTSVYSSRKPDREFTLAALEKLSLKPEEALIVGDSVFDNKSGENAGVAVCLVSTGGDSAEELCETCPWACEIFSGMETLAKGIWGLDLRSLPPVVR